MCRPPIKYRSLQTLSQLEFDMATCGRRSGTRARAVNKILKNDEEGVKGHGGGSGMLNPIMLY